MKLFGKKAAELRRTVHANRVDLATASFPTNKISNTKYTILTFLPLNLYEQFSRFMNIYFLIIACLQLWKQVTPVNPLTTWLPLILIFAVSAIKEGLDDYFRAQSDKAANNKTCQVSRDGVIIELRSADIVCGDVVYMIENEQVPADMVLLQSSSDGAAYIETANLDGETDLKSRTCLVETQALSREQIVSFAGVIECAGPNPDIYIFNSQMRMVADPNAPVLSLSVKQTLLQGTVLRNTPWVYGVVVYTGNQTKVGMNKRDPPVKWTHLDQRVNRTTVGIFLLQICFIIVFGILGAVWKSKNGDRSAYLFYAISYWYDPIVVPLRFMLLMSSMIPISLKVTMDFVKFYYAQLINWDLLMYDPETDTPAEAKSTAISEDLGQLEYVFSDKTGTLTENVMRFQKCAIGGIVYGHSETCQDALLDPALRAAVQDRGNVAAGQFFRCLSLNQTVVPNPERDRDGKVTYKSSSPDEEALVKAAQDIGVTFTTRDADNLVIDFCGTAEGYQLMNVLEFSSDRKRMSVILRDKSDGHYLMYMKGADDKVIARLDKRAGFDLGLLGQHLEAFASMGLRTLVIATKVIEAAEYEAWFGHWQQANNAIDEREAKLAVVYEEIETNMQLIGLTAIEDKLQDEVPETIALLRAAGIKVWMLTGDKFSTAVQIGTSCNLLSADGQDRLLHVAAASWEETLRLEHAGSISAEEAKRRNSEELAASLATNLARGRQLASQSKDMTMIIEGGPLGICLADHKESLRTLGTMCSAVICCRVTPAQKALVVAMVKELDKVCLSIGDGGNDVVMIQEAHVGVGISGREGLQAARAADYAFAKFKFLQRLILVHGRYSYYRTAFIAQYCFYKSMFICLIQVFYNIWAGYSGVSFFNTFSLTTYNVIFTGLPVFGYALDKDVVERLVFTFPQIYAMGQTGNRFSVRTLTYWGAQALFQALVSLLVTIAVFNVDHAHWGDGSQVDYGSLSMVTFTAMIVTNQVVVLLASRYVTLLNAMLLLGSIVALFGSTIVYAQVSSSDFYSVMPRLLSDGNFWATISLIVALSVLPSVFFAYVQRTYMPSQIDLVRDYERQAGSRGALGGETELNRL